MAWTRALQTQIQSQSQSHLLLFLAQRHHCPRAVALLPFVISYAIPSCKSRSASTRMAAAPQDVVLFDLPSKPSCACWSLNPWKTRLILNFKGVPYRTEWVEYPDIEATIKSYGIPPNETGPSAYTIPTVLLPPTTPNAAAEAHMDSQKIASVLEARYPHPPLHLDSPAVAKIEALFPKMLPPMAPNVLPLIPGNLLNPPSAEYFERTRSEQFGMSLPEFHERKGGEKAWEKATPVIEEIAALVKDDASGPFIMGATPSYADFYVVSTLKFLERIDPKILQRWLAVDPAFGELYEACQPWFQRDW